MYVFFTYFQSQVCDSRPDCLDASDECICASYQSCKSGVLFDMNYMKRKHTFFNESCFITPNCSEGVSQHSIASKTVKEIVNEGLLHDGFFEINATSNMQFVWPFDKDKLRDCAASTSSISYHCKNMLSESDQTESASVYHCSNNTMFYLLVKMEEDRGKSPTYQGFCDGIKNCANGIDEQNCPNMFYCKSDHQPVPMDKTCDTIPDCSDSSDECYNCTMSSYFASTSQLIGSLPVLIMVIFLAVTITPLNLYAVYFHQRRSSENTVVRTSALRNFKSFEFQNRNAKTLCHS